MSVSLDFSLRVIGKLGFISKLEQQISMKFFSDNCKLETQRILRCKDNVVGKKGEISNLSKVMPGH